MANIIQVQKSLLKRVLPVVLDSNYYPNFHHACEGYIQEECETQVAS